MIEEDDEWISKTQLKNQAKSLQDFARELVEMSSGKIEQLPLRDITKKAILDFSRQQGNHAKKRHIGYIGKCLREDDAQGVKDFLQNQIFEQQRQKQKQSDNMTQIVDMITEHGDEIIDVIVDEIAGMERQKMRQLVLNFKKSATLAKQQTIKVKILNFLQQFDFNEAQLLSQITDRLSIS
ncbi:MAG: DUF615 domain-containing protein [Gammaproteobacteria bacterium]|nr:DUF615 domain-containing protein [Gammaproteobacteria bacterium]MDH5628538.1 DUF615 domain-containing protein [Gammaproteobacteria bacterium]